MTFKFEVETTDKSGFKARTGKVTTAHGTFETPVFMSVGTRATVKTMTPRDLIEAGTKVVLGNTYHLALRPGEKLIKKMGGLHSFMAWDGPILTDSGGFQVFSLASLRKLSENGVNFRSHINGDLVEFTPERVMEIERDLGSDIVMPLDHCIGFPCNHKDAKEAMERSIRWLERSKNVSLQDHQTLFAIVQGSGYTDLREYCAKAMVDLDLPGYAIGGLAVGEDKETMQKAILSCNAILPLDKPRYLMGVGTPEDLLMAVAQGVDMFDCVMPTRNARGGGFFTWEGPKQIRNAQYRDDPRPLDPICDSYPSKTFSRSYLHHLFSKKVEEILGLSMLTLHNLTFYNQFMAQIREAIRNGQFAEFVAQFQANYQTKDGKKQKIEAS